MSEKIILANSDILMKIMDEKKAYYSIQDEQVPYSLIADPKGLLPMFLLEGSRYYEEMFDKKMNLTFYEEESILDYYPVLEDNNPGMSFWGHVMLDIVESTLKKNKKLIAKNENVPLDKLYEKWEEADKVVVPKPDLTQNQNKNNDSSSE